MKVLNPTLYTILQRRFGRVRVANQGVAMKSREGVDLATGRRKLVVDEGGEYYHVCCPFCRDTRFRLEINHRWGVRDESGSRNLHLAHCFNERCLTDPENLHLLVSQLEGTLGSLRTATILPGKMQVGPRISKLPGPCVTLSQLSTTHIARRFLLGRLVDPDLISKEFGVTFCTSSPNPHADSRIVAACRWKGKLVGWQARYVGDVNWKEEGAPAKWYSEPGHWKSLHLYNLEQAVKYQTVVVGEGPADAWSVGPMGTCGFGSALSDSQLSLLVSQLRFTDKTLVLLFDADVFARDDRRRERYEFGLEKLRKEIGERRVASVQLQLDFDPGQLCREFIHEYVAAEAAKQGVRVGFDLSPT